MPTRLFVTWSLSPSGPARQLTLLAPALPRDTTGVVVLGPSSPWCDQLRAAGVAVDVLGWRRPVDLRPLRELRHIVRAARPAVIHAWGPDAAWPLVLGGLCPPPALTVTAALSPTAPPGVATRALLRRVGRVVALGASEADPYRRLGVRSERITEMAPGVPVPVESPPIEWPGLPPDAPTIVVPGPITRHHGQFDAVWAIDILAFLHPDLHLVLLGDGPDVDRVRHFVGSCQRERIVHFPGEVTDPLPWLARADVVWIPALRDGGRMATLEAMAAGKPVIACRQPGLSELVVDGETGFLVPPGDKTDRCRLTRILLADPVLVQTMGAAGRRRVTEQFALAALVDRMRERDGV